MTKIKEAIQKAVEGMIVTQVIRAKVLEVDKSIDTCDVEPLNGGANYYNVRLKAVIDSTPSRIIAYPKVDSVVHIAVIENNKADVFITQITEFDSLLIENSYAKVEISEKGEISVQGDEITFNGDGLGGIVKAKELKAQVDKNTAILNAIQTVFKGWTPAPGDGGAVLKTASASFINMQRADLSKIENDKVKHG